MTSSIQQAGAARIPKSFAILLTASAGCALTVLDTNVVAVVLPTIARDLKATFADVEWVVSIYVLCFASSLLPAGAVADRYGRKRIFIIGLMVFTLASLFCGLAPSAKPLLLARAFQGVGAAFLLSPALAIIGHTFRNESERSRAWAVWGGMMGLTMVSAPIAGGLIASAAGWRWGFLINLPICAALTIASLFIVEDSRNETANRLDPAGIVLFAAAMFGITFGLISGQSAGWTTTSTLVGFSCGIAAFVSFILVERRQQHPMLDLCLFSEAQFVGAVLGMFAYAACAQVMASLLPIFFQNGRGNGAMQAGVAMLPFAIAMLIFPYVGRRLGPRFNYRHILPLGLSIVSIGGFVFAASAVAGSGIGLMIGMTAMGAGGGLLNGETQKAVIGSVSLNRAGMASGISTTARFSGILIGFTSLSGVIATTVQAILDGSEVSSSVGRAVSKRFSDAVVAGDLSASVANLPVPEQAAAIAQARDAYVFGFSAAIIVSAVVALIFAAIVYTLLNKGRSAAQ